MKIKTTTEFLTFNDGKCYIYSMKGNQIDRLKISLDFGDRVVGFKRHYAARASTERIDRLIHVPYTQNITSHDCAVICGIRYNINQIQQTTDSNPRSAILTLSQLGVVT